MRRGFTLIEMMAVIVIIAILASVVVVSVGEQGEKAKWRATGVLVHRVRCEVENFKLERNRYPRDLEELVVMRYREEVPLDAWGQRLLYRVPGTRGAPFDLVSFGSDQQPGGTGHAEDIWSHPPRN